MNEPVDNIHGQTTRQLVELGDAAAWTQWLADAGAQLHDLEAEDAAGTLIDRLRHSCTRATLLDVIVGEHDMVTGGKIVRAHEAGGEAARLAAGGSYVRTEPAADLGPGVACVRITTMRRRPNLFDLCQRRSVQRRTIAFALEDACRFGLVPGDPVAGLALGRSIFQAALMTGRAPALPATEVAATAEPPIETWSALVGDGTGDDGASSVTPSPVDLLADLAAALGVLDQVEAPVAEVAATDGDLAPFPYGNMPPTARAPVAEPSPEPPAEPPHPSAAREQLLRSRREYPAVRGYAEIKARY